MEMLKFGRPKPPETCESCEYFSLSCMKNHINLEPDGHPSINGCFNWMIPNLYIGNGCFTKHLFINGCLEFQEIILLMVRSKSGEKTTWDI